MQFTRTRQSSCYGTYIVLVQIVKIKARKSRAGILCRNRIYKHTNDMLPVVVVTHEPSRSRARGYVGAADREKRTIGSRERMNKTYGAVIKITVRNRRIRRRLPQSVS